MPALGVGTMRTAGAATAGATIHVTLNLTNQGVIGSQAELRSWLVRAMDDAGRLGRLPGRLNRAYVGG
jgi:hypothetical protein